MHTKVWDNKVISPVQGFNPSPREVGIELWYLLGFKWYVLSTVFGIWMLGLWLVGPVWGGLGCGSPGGWMDVTGARFENLKNCTISSSLMLSVFFLWTLCCFCSQACLLPHFCAAIVMNYYLSGTISPKYILPSTALVMVFYLSNREEIHIAVFASSKSSTAEWHGQTRTFLSPSEFPCLIFNLKDIWTHKRVFSWKCRRTKWID